MANLSELIIAEVSRSSYTPMTPKALLRRLGVPDHELRELRKTLSQLVKAGKVRYGKSHLILPATPPQPETGVVEKTAQGDVVVRSTKKGKRYEIPDLPEGIRAGDQVQFDVTRRGGKAHSGAAKVVPGTAPQREYVGTYFVRNGQHLVRLDSDLFQRSVLVRDAQSHGVHHHQKVVVEIVRFPVDNQRAEAVITEVLGNAGDPRVDLHAILRAAGIPEKFSQQAHDEAISIADQFDPNVFPGRQDDTQELVITIDPADAKDFDDAISVQRLPKSGHWQVRVYIADVSAFVPRDSQLDREARLRGTSVYLPQHVVPMLPEIISNSLASLQEGVNRFVKCIQLELSADGGIIHRHCYNAVICNRKRFNYEQVQEILEDPDRAFAWNVSDDIVAMLRHARELMQILHERRQARGALELELPEPVLEYDAEGHLSGAHHRQHLESHRIIEELMLLANEAVAAWFAEKEVPIIRRLHPTPLEEKLKQLAAFAKVLGYKVPRKPGRTDLQKLLQTSRLRPDRAAVHYATLRTMKQAIYSTDLEEHFALAAPHYCHFTSPIRRYPDLIVHRCIDSMISKGRNGYDRDELATIAAHCSVTERRAEDAERAVVQLRLLYFLQDRVGMKMAGVITGVHEYGFFVLGNEFPIEGLVHVSTLGKDFYQFDDEERSLTGAKSDIRYRLGDTVRVEVAQVDIMKKQLNFTIVPSRSKRKGNA